MIFPVIDPIFQSVKKGLDLMIKGTFTEFKENFLTGGPWSKSTWGLAASESAAPLCSDEALLCTLASSPAGAGTVAAGLRGIMRAQGGDVWKVPGR